MSRAGKLLAIDDDPINLDIIHEMFDEYDHELMLCDNPDQGLALCEDFNPDILLLDIMMPKTNGYDICKSIREELHNRDMTIVMVTGKILTSDRIEAFKVGADDYITKPFSTEEMHLKINYYLTKHL